VFLGTVHQPMATQGYLLMTVSVVSYSRPPVQGVSTMHYLQLKKMCLSRLDRLYYLTRKLIDFFFQVT
jgi:hypothetical protein